MFDLSSNPISFIFYAISLLVAITVHEFAHAYSADRLGDPTPRLQGRLTLNPLAHLDPIGTIMLLLVRFGWGKPVQFDPFNLRHPRRDAAIISLAGPATNISLAIVAAILIRIISLVPSTSFYHAPLPANLVLNFLAAFLQTLIIMNVVLAVFNFLPIHPLDGFKIVGGILTPTQARDWYSLERYGMIFLLFLLLPLFGPTPPIQLLISPPINFLLRLLLPNVPLA